MSMNRIAIVSAIGTHNYMKNRSDDIRFNKHPVIETQERPSENQFNGDVNVLLGGALFSIIVSLVCFLCYFCHRSLQRRDIIYQQRWVHMDPNMDIYSVEQYYDISANNGIDEDQYTQMMRNQGPPPAYEIAVAMKNPMKMEKCHLCQNTVRSLCDSHTAATEGEENKMINSTNRAPDQLLNVKNISQTQNLHFCNCESVNRRNIRETCDMCVVQPTCENHNLREEDIQNGNIEEGGLCQCTNSCCRVCGKEFYVLPDTPNDHDINDNVPSTSGDGNFYNDGDYEDSDREETDGEAEFDSLNENGLIRVDMRKLIDDQTGLPTYEAALKLESSGYV